MFSWQGAFPVMVEGGLRDATPHPATGIQKCIECEAPKIAKLVYNSNNSNNYGLWYV